MYRSMFKTLGPALAALTVGYATYVVLSAVREAKAMEKEFSVKQDN